MAHEARVRFAALTALLAGILGAQEALPPLPVDRQMPTPGELLPLRPLAPEDGKDGAVPIRYWGQDVQETGEGWTMNHGAVESPDLLLLADHIRYNTATSEIQAEGHIRIGLVHGTEVLREACVKIGALAGLTVTARAGLVLVPELLLTMTP